MTGDAMHDYRAKTSALKLADILADRARSLARFPAKRLDESMVTYDLLIATVHAALLQLANHEPSTARTLAAQFADELRLLVETHFDTILGGTTPARGSPSHV